VSREEYIAAARELFGSDDVEVDDDAKLSEVDEVGERGAWVSAWVWVPEA